MAMKCSVCDAKIGSFAKYNTWIPGRDDLPICLGCTEKLKEAKRTNINPEHRMSLKMQRDAVEFLTGCMQRETMGEEVRSELKKQLPAIDDILAQQEESKRQEEDLKKRVEEARKNFLTTTESSIHGYRIVKCEGVISVDSIIGTGLIADTASALSDTVGTKSNKLATRMGDAKNQALQGAIERAVAAGVNALIGVSFFPYAVNGNMMGVSATGTAVQVEKIPDTAE